MVRCQYASPYNGNGALTREQFLFHKTSKFDRTGLGTDRDAKEDSGTKKVLIPAISMIDFATVPPDLMAVFQLIPYQSAEDTVFKVLGGSVI